VDALEEVAATGPFGSQSDRVDVTLPFGHNDGTSIGRHGSRPFEEVGQRGITKEAAEEARFGFVPTGTPSNSRPSLRRLGKGNDLRFAVPRDNEGRVRRHEERHVSTLAELLEVVAKIFLRLWMEEGLGLLHREDHRSLPMVSKVAEHPDQYASTHPGALSDKCSLRSVGQVNGHVLKRLLDLRKSGHERDAVHLREQLCHDRLDRCPERVEKVRLEFLDVSLPAALGLLELSLKVLVKHRPKNLPELPCEQTLQALTAGHGDGAIAGSELLECLVQLLGVTPPGADSAHHELL
jgi:hypothetical protein